MPTNTTKTTKGAAATTAGTAGTAGTAAQPADTGDIDLSKLTPEQLAALQKQLKLKKKETAGDTTERFNIIDALLKEKVVKGDEKAGEKAGEFKYTTRDILNRLVDNNLIADKSDPKWDQIEIKKIQARKQFLEKKRKKDGTLEHPEGTFGYRVSAGQGFSLTPVRIEAWFQNADNLKGLTLAQKASIAKAIGAKL